LLTFGPWPAQRPKACHCGKADVLSGAAVLTQTKIKKEEDHETDYYWDFCSIVYGGVLHCSINGSRAY
jgi:hypothetical protein